MDTKSICEILEYFTPCLAFSCQDHEEGINEKNLISKIDCKEHNSNRSILA